MSTARRPVVLLALLPAVAGAVVALRRLAARSNTQVHRINQN
jgi:hypothetical protein